MDRYTQTKELAADRSRKVSAKGRDIGSPREEPYDDERRAAAHASLRLFLESYFPAAFPLAWSNDHLEAIRTLERVANGGGLFALAMPRGSGKTSISIRAALWALLTGRRSFVEIISGTESAARKIIKTLRNEVCLNRTLHLDYPGELHGFWELQASNRRAAGQLCQGQPTLIEASDKRITFPSHQYSPIAGAVIYSAGITGQVRGENATSILGDATISRPDLVILDDVQTRESAKSPVQNQQRIEIVEGDVLGLAGPGEAIAVVMPCTVIAKNDLAEYFLSHKEWSATRAKLLPSFPTNLKLWDQYFEVRSECQRVDGNDVASQDFYLANRAALEEGAVEGWPARKQPGEISALQSAMHLWYRSPSAFAAEYQNEPLVDASDSTKPTTIALSQKLIGLKRGIVPKWATKVTAAVDCQMTCLYWMVVAWGDDFTGHIVDYGVTPEQSRNYFSLREISPTLQQMSGSSQVEGALRWGLDSLAKCLLGKAWEHEDGGEMRITKMLVDAGYKPDTVHEFVLRSAYAAVVLPCLGLGITAAKAPMERWPARPNEHMGWHWVTKRGEKRKATYGQLDTYHWKTFLCERIAAVLGEKGALTVFGDRPEVHRLLMDHLNAESPTQTFGQGRAIWEWQMRGVGMDNHWLDCLASNCAAASMLGSRLPGDILASPAAKTVRLSDLQKQKKLQRGER